MEIEMPDMTATPQGVVKSDRQQMMDEINASRTEQIKQEIRDGGGDPDVLDAAPVTDENKPADENGEVQLEGTAQVDQPASMPAVEPKKTKIKVDGQEVEVDDDKIREAGIRALQKESAADKRLEEAARLKAEAEGLIVAAKAAPAQNQDRTDLPAALPAGGRTVVEKLTDDDFIQAVKAIQYGSETEARDALKNLVSQAATSGQTDELTLAQVNEYLDFREATKWVHDEYKDILGDVKLKALFANEEKRLRAAGDMRPYREIYTDIGNGLREWKTGLAPADPNPKPAPQSRSERKATVVNIPSAAARQPAPQTPKEPTPSETIDKMRAARHQSV